MMQYGHRPQMRMAQVPGQMPGQMPIPMPNSTEGFDGKMLRKTIPRKTVDFNPSAVHYLENRIWKRDYRDERAIQADPLYMQSLTLPQDMLDNPVSCVTTKFIRAALNKDPRPVFCACWTPDGRRLITGASSGEFTLWNGLTFNFETILQAHNCSVRSMIWSRNAQWMITGDDRGYIKYWQANMNNVKMFQGHLEAIRGLSFSPTDAKFTSCSDDRTVRIFDFVTCHEESVLSAHGSDVKCVDWHPIKGLIVSGSKDSQQPIILWDARNAKKIMTLHAHKNTCTDLKWNSFNENWLISSSKDHLCKLFDLRKLKEEVQSFRGHKKDVCTVAWHPIYEKLFVSGGLDGSMFFWHVGSEKELGFMEDAHEAMIWDLSWHPLGHILVSGSNDRSTRFWTRNRPGDITNDKIEELSSYKNDRVTGIIFKNIEITPVATDNKEEEVVVSLPGLGLDKDMLEQPAEDEESRNSPVDADKERSGHYSHSYSGRRGDTYDDDDDYRRKKAPYSKPIPKEFEKAWKSNAASGHSEGGGEGGDRSRQIPSLLASMSSKSSSGQPIALMDLMSTKIEPPSNIRFNDKHGGGGGSGGGRNKKRRNEKYNDYD